MNPGHVVLFGSGETSASAQPVHDRVMHAYPPPVRVSVLETPAGFQLNSADVAGAVADYVRDHLPNHSPQVSVVPARKRGTPFSPDDPGIVAPLLRSDVIFLGPGSPTYAVRQLRHSLAWRVLQARHRRGAAVVLASAAAIAAGSWALPVYEIYKVGEDPHWVPGLDLLSPYGLSLALVPHWNNTEGGAKHDTSRCFMGEPRFQELLGLLPAGVSVVGIDELTALSVDLGAGRCEVLGLGGVTVMRPQEVWRVASPGTFALSRLGQWRRPSAHEGIPSAVWQMLADAERERATPPEPPPEVLRLALERDAARARGAWATADMLRDQVRDLGWQIRDTADGPRLLPID